MDDDGAAREEEGIDHTPKRPRDEALWRHPKPLVTAY
jgi:hypothetical protein